MKMRTRPLQKKINPTMLDPFMPEQLKLFEERIESANREKEEFGVIEQSNFYVGHVKRATTELVVLDKCLKYLKLCNVKSGYSVLSMEKARLLKDPAYRHANEILESIRKVNGGK